MSELNLQTTSVWHGASLPVVQAESHFGDRVVHAFKDRAHSIFELLQNTVTQHPDRLALVCGSERLTWREVDVQAARLAACFAHAGLVAGDRVVLFQGNSTAFVMAFMAIQRLGAIAVAVGAREQRAGLTWIFQHCGAKAVVCDADLLDRLPSQDEAPDWQWTLVNGPCPEPSAAWGRVFSFQEGLAFAPLTEVAPVHEEDTAIILYTSGTTGRPKGAMLTHFNVLHSVQHYVTCMGLSCDDRSMLGVPVTHVTGLIANLMSMVGVAGALLILPSFKADDFLQMAEMEGMTHTLMVPAMYKLLLMSPRFDSFNLRSWRIGGFGGAPMPPSTIDEMAVKLPHLHLLNAYGATETTSPTTLMPMGKTRDHLDSVGQVLPCAQVLVMDERGHQLPPGVVGELWISGPMVVKGYWNDAAATAREMTAGWWHSGDLGSVDAQGYVRIFDRKKDMINRGGYKIFSVEVENVLLEIPGIVEAAIVGVACPVLGERVHAVVHTLRSDFTLQTLQVFCEKRLADYKVPETLRISAHPLPRNPNGKIIKRELRAQTVQ